MRSIGFDYARHRQGDIPLVPVSLRSGGKWSEVWAYVDSGCFYIVFDDKVADLLELKLLEGEKVLAVVGDGSFIPVYLHKVGMRIGVDEFAVKIGFSSKLGVGFNLLGVDMFDRYRVTFDNRSRKVIFQSHDATTPL
jgi:predicted aspartyl protease